MSGQYIIINQDTQDGAIALAKLIFTEIFAWSDKSLAHTLTEATPRYNMTLADGYDYTNLFGTSMNGRDNICIDFEHDSDDVSGDLRFTLPEKYLVSGVFIDAAESTKTELTTIDVQVYLSGSGYTNCNTQLDFENAGRNIKALSTTCDDIGG